MTSTIVLIPFIYYFNGLSVCIPLVQWNSSKMKDRGWLILTFTLSLFALSSICAFKGNSWQLGIPEPQTQRVVGRGGEVLTGITYSEYPAQTGSASAGCSKSSSTRFGISPRIKTPKLYWAACFLGRVTFLDLLAVLLRQLRRLLCFFPRVAHLTVYIWLCVQQDPQGLFCKADFQSASSPSDVWS